jgi:hypothetical protein
MWWLVEQIIAHAPDAVPTEGEVERECRHALPCQRAALLRRLTHLGVVNLPAAELQAALDRLAAGETVETVARAVASAGCPATLADAGAGRARSPIARRLEHMERAEVA